jgi:hypothetical protein
MNASSSAIDSALSFARPTVPAVDPYEVRKRTLRVIILDIAMPGQNGPGELHPLSERRKAARVLLLTLSGQTSEAERKARSIQARAETWPRKVCRQAGIPQRSWVHAAICALLACCCAVTVFSVFQAPFRLRANENQTSTVKFRAETAALPASLTTQTVLRFRPHGARQNVGCNNEVAGNCVDDSARKRRPGREGLLQQKQSRVSIQSGPFSERK